MKIEIYNKSREKAEPLLVNLVYTVGGIALWAVDNEGMHETTISWIDDKGGTHVNSSHSQLKKIGLRPVDR